MIKHTDEFKREAVRIAQSSGLSRDQVASDLGVGNSTLHKWISHYRPAALAPDLTYAVNAVVGVEHAPHLDPKCRVAARARRQAQ